MADPTLTPVDFDPFAAPAPSNAAATPPVAVTPTSSGPTLTPVDHDPFADSTPSISNPNAVPTGPKYHELPGAQKIDHTQDSFLDRLSDAAASPIHTLVAATQNTSPVVRDAKGNLNYQPLAEYGEYENGGVYVPDPANPNHMLPFDPAKHVVLFDPATNKDTIFARSPETDTSVGTSLGRVLGIGMMAPSNVGGPSAVARAPSQSEQLLNDYSAQGVPATIPAVTQNRTTQIVQNTLRDMPGVAGTVQGKAQNVVDKTGQAVENLAAQYGAATNAEDAGKTIQSGIQDFAKSADSELSEADIIKLPTRASSFSEKADALYNRLWSKFQPTDQIPLNNTLDALNGPMSRIAENPALGSLMTNQKLKQFYDVLKPQTVTTPAQTSKILDATGQPIVTQAAQTTQTGGTLSLAALKEMRSFIGRQLQNPSLVSDIPTADLKNVYAGISRDIQTAASAKGPDALKAFQDANNYYRAGMGRIEQIEGLLGPSAEGAYSNVLATAQSGSKADIAKLTALRRSIPDDQWGDIASATLNRMGEATPGASNPLNASNFSPGKFVTEYNKLTPAGRDLIFNSTGNGELRNSLDQLARIAASQKNVAALANNSGTGRVGLTGMMGAGAAGAVSEAAMTGHLPMATIGTALTALGTGQVAARAMMNPTFTRWLVRLPGVVKAGGDAGQTVGESVARVLPQISNNPGLTDVAAAMQNAFTTPQPEPPTGHASGGRISKTMPEPPTDIAAQIHALSSPNHPKDAVFVAAGNESAIPESIPSGVTVVHRPHGVLLTTNQDKANQFRDTTNPTDKDMARILGYPAVKSNDTKTVIQSRDAGGSVVYEAATNPISKPATIHAARMQTPAGGGIKELTPRDALMRRNIMAPSSLVKPGLPKPATPTHMFNTIFK